MAHLEELLESLKHLNLEGEIVDKKPQVQGYGGFSDVFCAWSRKLKKSVAVKQVRAHLKFDPKLTKRLAREIRIWVKLCHPNVLPFLGFLVDGEDLVPSLISEWMANGTLFHFMKTFPRGGIITRIILRGIASGLHHLHSHSVIHADLKSANILISSFGIPLVADFGLSMALTQTQSMQTVNIKGTVRWMAIELLSSKEDEPPRIPDEKSDIWAFGMIIYELLSWNIPYWKRKNDIRVAMDIIDGSLPTEPNKGRLPYVFDSLWALACLCWSRESARRPNAVSLVEHLSLPIEPLIVEWSSFKRLRLWRKAIFVCIAANRLSSGGQRHAACAGQIHNTIEERCLVGSLRPFSVLWDTAVPRFASENGVLPETDLSEYLYSKFLVEKTAQVPQHISNLRVAFKEVGCNIHEIGLPTPIAKSLVAEWSRILEKLDGILHKSGNASAQGRRTISGVDDNLKLESYDSPKLISTLKDFTTTIVPKLRSCNKDRQTLIEVLKQYKETLSDGKSFARDISGTYEGILTDITQFDATCLDTTKKLRKELARPFSKFRFATAQVEALDSNTERTKSEVNTLVDYRERVMNGVSRILVGSLRTRSDPFSVCEIAVPTKKLKTARNALKGIDELVYNAVIEIESLLSIWWMLYQEILEIEAKITLIIQRGELWMTDHEFHSRLGTLPAAYATMKMCLELYAKAVTAQ